MIKMEPDARRQAELQAYHQFKQNKENADVLYLVDQKWIERWIEYLRGNQDSPDYINNEKLHTVIFEEQKARHLKMNEDFILVHKSLFEYLYGLYGCDYFVQAKQYQRPAAGVRLSKSPAKGPATGVVGAKTSEQSTLTSSNKNQMGNQDSMSHASFISASSSSWQRVSKGQPVVYYQNKDLSLAQRIEESKKAQIQQDLEAQLSEGIVGLQNYSYFCYLNSCLQCLLAIDQLKFHFLNREFRKFKDLPRVRNTFRLSLSFTKFYQDVWLKKNNQQLFQEVSEGRQRKVVVVVSPDYIKTEIVNKFSPVYQHDCHEFFTYIMSNL